MLESNVRMVYSDEICGRLVNNKLQGQVRVYNKREDQMQHFFYFRNRQQSSFKIITNSSNQIIKMGFMIAEEENQDNSRIYQKQDENPSVNFLLHGFGMKIITLHHIEKTEGFFKYEKEKNMVPYNKLISRGKEYYYKGEWMNG